MSYRMGHWSEGVIKALMKDHGIDPNQVTGRLRYQIAHGYGFFNCQQCKSRWSSYYAWISFDLRKQKIKFRFGQKCQKEGCCKMRACRPLLLLESIRDMMEIICIRYGMIKNGEIPPKKRAKDQEVKTKKPHLVTLCEKCGYGNKNPCWL